MKLVVEGNIVFPDTIKYGQIEVLDGVIYNIKTDDKCFVNPDIKIPESHYIAPGFIDLQVNGGFGKEFKTDEDAIDVVSNHLYRYGTTTFCPTVTTSEFDRYQKHVQKLIENYQYTGQSKIIGLHLEGPMLNPKKVGAQNSDLLLLPSEIDKDKYLSSNVKIVTLSPELEGAFQFVDILKQKGIKIGLGHSIISYEDVMKFFDIDNMMIVHLFNAMDGLTARQPGLVGAGLMNDDFTISIIADGVHLHPEILKHIWKSKNNKNKIICITDGSAVTGLDTGVYQIGSRTIQKTDTTATLPNGTLVGSVLTQNIAVRNMIKYCGCSLCEAINTVSYNPALYLGVDDKLGSIKVGNVADLVVISEKIEIAMVFINGILKYEK